MTKHDEIFFGKILDLVYGPKPERQLEDILNDDKIMTELFRENMEAYFSKSLYDI